MPSLIRPDGTEIYYEVHGQGYPLLLLAPGGVSSDIAGWQGRAFNPIQRFKSDFMVIAMDQRHAGRSRSPLIPFSYGQTMGDQIAVLNDLGVARAHVMGGCIGCAFALRLLDEAPARISAAVLQDPVGRDATNSMGTYYAKFNETLRVCRSEGLDAVVAAAKQNGRFVDNAAGGPWSQRLHDQDAFAGAVRSLGREGYIALVVDFRDGIWPVGSEFFSVNEVAVKRIGQPLLILPGNDELHPTGVAERLGALALNAETLTVDCREPAHVEVTVERIRRFLQDNTPD